MSPRISDPRNHNASRGFAVPHGLTASRGFTFMELMIGMVVSGLLVIVITRFFRDSHRAYNVQELLSERDQNAQYVLNRIGDRLMEVGANLPESGIPIVLPGVTPSSPFSLIVNPAGGSQSFYADLSATQNIPIDDETGYSNATAVLIVRADRGMPVELTDIATGYNLNGFTKGLKKGIDGPDTLRLSSAKGFVTGDALYAYSKEDYSVASTDLSMGRMVLAEDIESLGLNFYDSTGTATTDWNKMHSAKVSVTARTQRPDPGYTGDGYRRVTITSEIRLRNRP
jgi:type IV pilus assembly protein PilW